MEIEWLQHHRNDALIIFCNGWGMDSGVVANLDCENFDIVVISAYDSLSCPTEIANAIPLYKKWYLISWSMGVWIGAILFSQYASQYSLNAALAINGTLLPIDKQYGIAPEIFLSMYNTFCEKNRIQFYQQMCGKSYHTFTQNLPKRSLLNQKNELAFFLNQQKRMKMQLSSPYSDIIIYRKDRIMLARNQRRFWQKRIDAEHIIEQQGNHYPFDMFSSWHEIIAVTQK